MTNPLGKPNIINKALHHPIDTRRNIDELKEKEGERKKQVQSIACQVLYAPLLVDHQFYQFQIKTFRVRFKEIYKKDLNPTEKFLEEPAFGFSTAFFVGGPKNNLLLTAAHCVNEINDFKNARFIFDFHNANKECTFEKEEKGEIGELRIRKNKVYAFKKIVAMGDEGFKGDWALIKVEKEGDEKKKELRKAQVITDRSPLQLDLDKILRGNEPLHMLGHPEGLPMKIADNAIVTAKEKRHFFKANLDGFCGNSGSPVINEGKVVGIFIAGFDDYKVKNGILEPQHYSDPKLDETCQRLHTIDFLKWYFQRDQVESQLQLGLAYLNGTDGVQKDSPEEIQQTDKKAAKYFEKAAESHDPRALYWLSKCYIEGTGIIKDEKKGFRLLEEAIKKGNQDALNFLNKLPGSGNHHALFYRGRCFEYGYGFEMNHQKAFENYKKAAEKGSPHALHALANCYFNGIGVAKDTVEAFKYYQLAADKDIPAACFDVAIHYSKNKIEEAFKYLKKAADQNHVLASCFLGHWYEKGIGTNKNIKEAFKYLKKAADSNLVDESKSLQCGAAYKVGEFYRLGIETEQSMEKAFKYFLLAADNGFDWIGFYVGLHYYDGLGIEQNQEKAFKYFKLAADSKNFYTPSIFMVACCYQVGIGVEKDGAKAFEYYLKAADTEKGHPEAAFLAALYFHGENNHAKAFEYYKKSADAGHAQASYELAKLYSEGKVQKDEKMIFYYYKRAADLGHQPAFLEVGICYMNGSGVDENIILALEYFDKDSIILDKDLAYEIGDIFFENKENSNSANKAYKYFLKSSDKGHADAHYQVALCYSNAIGVAKDEKKALGYFKKAVKSQCKNVANAYWLIGTTYQYGADGIEKNKVKALKYLKKAYDLGHPQARAAYKKLDEECLII